MSQASKSEEPDRRELKAQLSQALENVDSYKNELAVTNSLLEEAEELVGFTWEQVESAEETARQNADAAKRADQLEQDKAKLKEGLQDSTASIRQIQEVADAAEERAYLAEEELYRREQEEGSKERELFEKALDLAVCKAKRYERGLAVLVFQRIDEQGEEERIAQVLRDSDMFGQLDDSTYGVIIEEDLPHHDIGECIERLSARIGRPSATSILGADSDKPDQLIEIAMNALDHTMGGPR
jgi:cysteinyl-tRNA synthetase